MQTDVGRVGLYASEFTRAPPVNAPAWTGPGGRAASYLPFGGGEPYAYPRFEVSAAAHGRGSHGEAHEGIVATIAVAGTDPQRPDECARGALTGVVLVVMLAGTVYRTECTYSNGAHTVTWGLEDGFPYLWSPGNQACEAHTLTRYALGDIGILSKPSP